MNAPSTEPVVAPSASSAIEVATTFLAAWERGDWSVMTSLVAEPSMMPDAYHRTAWETLGVTDTEIAIGAVVETVGLPASATIDFVVFAELMDLGQWSYTSRLVATKVGGDWKVDWLPTVLHPALVGDRKLSRASVWEDRAPILAWDRQPLVTDRDVVEIGVEPQRITDRAVLVDALVAVLGLDANGIEAALDAPGIQPDWFIPMAALRPGRFEELDPVLRPVPGVVFRRTAVRLPPADDFAIQVLGQTGEITFELLQAWGEPYAIGDVVGLSGLELAYESRLAGRPASEIRVIGAAGELLEVLQRYPGVAPISVQTTLDVALQVAADSAMSGVEQPAALVVIDSTTGQVRAATSRPSDEFNRALVGLYPPGSTFKVITAAALLGAGIAPDDPVSCPQEVVVDGRVFSNINDMTLGSIPFRTAFARSCNTAFASLAADMDADTLRNAADSFGFDTSYVVGVDAAGGRYPSPVDIADRAAAAIGQGRVTASPLHMASVAAAVSSGGWQPPTLVLDPAVDVLQQHPPLDSQTVSSLTSMMREVVEHGTGTAAAVPGPPVAGKTGSAEYGEDDPPMSHAWFIGFRDDIAFAVLVEGGGSGGAVAAPVAAAFLDAAGSRP